MNDKERHAAFYDQSQWAPSVEFPSNGFVRVLAFTYYQLTIYSLQIYTSVYHWDTGRHPEYRKEWDTRFYFIRKGGYLEVESITDIWKLMKEAEKQEFGS